MSCQTSRFKDPETGKSMVIDSQTGILRERCEGCGSGGGCRGLVSTGESVTMQHLSPELKRAAKEFYAGWLNFHGIRRQSNGTFRFSIRPEEAARRYNSHVQKTGLPPVL